MVAPNALTYNMDHRNALLYRHTNTFTNKDELNKQNINTAHTQHT